MTEQPPSTASSSSTKKKLLIGGAGALVVAAGIFVAFVLPAEFGIDPTGIGKATGLVQIADSAGNAELERGMKRSGVLTLSDSAPAPEPGTTDRWEIDLGPYESVEFKYEIAQGKAMTFTWEASAPLRYDMHSHPFDGGTDITESYGIGTAQTQHGRYVAPFTGIHGWYWQNRTLDTVKLVLNATGAVEHSTVFDSAGEHARPLSASPE